jgi:5,10-methylenetetrahydrofolate reductase
MLHCNRNAGGRTSDLTSEMVKTCQSIIGIETCMHLTCTNMPKQKVDIALKVKEFTLNPVNYYREFDAEE